MELRKWFLFIFLVSSITTNFGQCPQANFTIKPNACTNENIQAWSSNPSTQIIEWDFCDGSIFNVPNVTSKGSLSGVSRPYDFQMIQNNNLFYSFIVSRDNSKIFRLSYGMNPTDPPSSTELTLLNGRIHFPQGIFLYKEQDSFYALISTSDGFVHLISFGSDLTNNPTEINKIAIGLNLNHLTISLENNNLYAFIVGSSSLLNILDFGSSILNVPTLRQYQVPSTNLGGVTLTRECDQRLLLIVGSRLSVANFGLTYSNVPSFTSSPWTLSPVNIKVVYSLGKYIAYVPTNDYGKLYKVEFGNSIVNSTNPIVTNLGNFGFVYGNFGFDIIKLGAKYYAAGIGYYDNLLSFFDFPKDCDIIDNFQNNFHPEVSYNSSGNYSVTSLIIDDQKNMSSQTSTVLVSALSAPNAIINVGTTCIINPTLFTASTLDGSIIQNYNWDFGDGESSVQANPNHIYTYSGNYEMSLIVEATNGCTNLIEKTIKIYDPPVAEFTLPPGLICTNNEFTFVNSTVDNFDGNLTYEWLVNDVQKSTARDFLYTFSTEGDQQVKLKTSIPGCSSEMTQLISNVQTGPIVDFDYTGKCEDEEILFTNQSSGSINAFDWDFENSNTSTEENPSVIFSDYGDYNVSLSAIAPNGCVSTIKKPVAIYSVPQTNFSIDLPPFACSNTPSQFNDLTPPMPDSNITSWQWTFGDPSIGASSQRNPSFTYALAGNYDVSLTTTSNFGCTNSIQKTVTIFPSPQADFSFGTACVNQETQFTDLSTGDIKSWLWSMQGNTYSEQNLKHKFLSASTHAALLTVTGTNNCISQATKNVFVPSPVIADFTSTTTCATKPALFDEINKGGSDPAVSWTWNFASQGSGSGSPAQHVFSSIGNYSVTMNTTRQSGCTYSVTKTIPIVEPPIAQFTTSREAGGAPLKVDFTNTSLNATNYYWKFGDATNTTSAQFSPSFTYIDLGEYHAELTAINPLLHCEDSYSQLITVVIPRINAAMYDFRLGEIPGSDNLSPVITIENNSNVDLMNTEVYLDLSGNSLIHENISAVIKPNESYAYSFTQNIAPRTLAYVCAEVKVDGDEYAFDNRQCINLQDEYVSQEPYPNPTNSELMLEWINVVDEPMHLVIYNASGQSIISRQYSPTLKGLNQVKLDVSGLSTGIYFVSYVVNGQTQNFKFSIIR